MFKLVNLFGLVNPLIDTAPSLNSLLEPIADKYSNRVIISTDWISGFGLVRIHCIVLCNMENCGLPDMYAFSHLGCPAKIL